MAEAPPVPSFGDEGGSDGGSDGGAAVVSRPGAPDDVVVADVLAYNGKNGDPRKTLYTLPEALIDLEGDGTLVAEFVTPRGVIQCELFEERTPLTVANFVGLARGRRVFKDAESEEWITRPYYDGTTFHRVIPGFMIQGGDPTGTRMGNPGFVIPDEIRPDLIHDRAGVLSMANRGPNTGGAQFFITLGPTPNLDGKHAVFGGCSEDAIALADDISIAPRDEDDKPLQDEVVESVRIVRIPNWTPSSGASAGAGGMPTGTGTR